MKKVKKRKGGKAKKLVVVKVGEGDAGGGEGQLNRLAKASIGSPAKIVPV